MFFNYLHHEDYISTNYMKQIKFQKESKVVIQSFTNDEVSRMIKVYSNENFLNSRNKCIIVMLFDTGVRNSELCDFSMNDIKEKAILIHGKGDKQRNRHFCKKSCSNMSKNAPYTLKKDMSKNIIFSVKKQRD